MGRPRSFHERDAIAAAAEVFRGRGYAETSIDDLVAATGVHRGSLYGVFGSKHGLFLRVLEAADTADTADTDARLDIALIALMELAATDEHVAEAVRQLLDRHSITATDLGERLVARASSTPQGRGT